MHESNFPLRDRFFSSAFQYAAIGMALVAPDGHWLMVNKSLCQLVGYDESELLSKTFQDITHPDDLGEDLTYVNKMLSGEIDTYQMEKRYFHKNGNIIHILLSVSLVWDDNKKPIFFISQIQDITERIYLEKELIRHATEDALTGVNNRRRFFEFAEREIVRGGRFNESMVLLMIDIDYFKKINDAYGHDIGDKVLKAMASTCKSALRAVDVFGRIGGEEFGALLVNTDAVVGKQVAERLRKSIESLVVETEKGSINFTISIGAVAFTGNKQPLERRMKQADIALYEAKNAGRNLVKMDFDFVELDETFESMQTGFIRLVWKKLYECCNETIDSQHKQLFEISNDLLVSIISAQDAEVCKAMIDNLANHVSVHFNDEEKILQSYCFPFVEDHKKIHNKLKKQMEILINKYRNGNLSIGELFGFLAVDVISKHMLNEDRKFFSYLT